MALEDIRNAQQLSPYILWLLSRMNPTQPTAVSAPAVAALAAQNVAPTAPTSFAPNISPLYGSDLGAALRQYQRQAPGSFAGTNIYPTQPPTPASMMQEPSSISSSDALNMLRQALGIGEYQFPDMSKDTINKIASAWEDLNTNWATSGTAFEATYDTVTPRYELADVNGELVPLDPTNTVSQRMAGVFNMVRGGYDPDAILKDKEIRKLGLTDQEKSDLKLFGSEQRTRDKASAKIEAEKSGFARTYGLPDPNLNWEIPSDVAATIWQRQKTGLTDRQAAQQAMDVALAEWEQTRQGYVPKTRADLTAEAMRRAGIQETAATRDASWIGRGSSPITAAKESRTATGAAERVGRAGGSADAAEAAGMAAVSRANAPQPSFAAKATSKPKDDKKRKEMEKMVEAQVRAEGYRAMRGERTGGDIGKYTEYQKAKRAFESATSREEKLAAQVAMDLTDRVGTPFESAIIQARALVNAQSKNYPTPGGRINAYPANYGGI